MMRPLCAWVSTHDPLPGQRAALAAYDLVVIRTRPATVVDAWLDVLAGCCNQTPALLMPILHHAILTPLVLRVAQISPSTIVIRPMMHRPARSAPWIWRGEWLRYVVVSRGPHLRGTEMLPWCPESEVPA